MANCCCLMQVASLRKQKAAEAREEESEEIKNIKKVFNIIISLHCYKLEGTVACAIRVCLYTRFLTFSKLPREVEFSHNYTLSNVNMVK